MGQDLLVSGCGRCGGWSRCDRLSAVEGIEGGMGVIDTVHCLIGTILRVDGRRRVRGRAGMYSGGHDVIQFRNCS